MNKPIYLDYAATTPIHEDVAKEMLKYMTFDGEFGNPASRSHIFGWQAEEAIDIAREQIANAINADTREIIFTSGATEADNLAIKGAANFIKSKGNHIITSKTEHKAVLDTCRQMEKDGFKVTYLTPESNGLILLENIKNAITDETILISIMHVNSEIGVIQNIKEIGQLTREKGILFHVDAAQSLGKTPIDVQDMNIDLLSISAHKVYGPKGIGALYVRRKPKVRIQALIHGGGHERGMRSGTLATHQIVGFGKAVEIAVNNMTEENKRIQKLQQRLLNGLKNIEQIYINGDLTNRIVQNLNISFAYVEGESLLMALKDLAVSSGSACTSASLEPSYVLKALGLNDELAHSSIRFSLGKYTTEADIDKVIALTSNAVNKLRDMSPLWDMFQEGIDLDSVEWQEH